MKAKFGEGLTSAQIRLARELERANVCSYSQASAAMTPRMTETSLPPTQHFDSARVGLGQASARTGRYTKYRRRRRRARPSTTRASGCRRADRPASGWRGRRRQQRENE